MPAVAHMQTGSPGPLRAPFTAASSAAGLSAGNCGLLLVQAYTEAFQSSDEVALIVHSSYGDHFWEQELQDSMHNSSQPAVVFFQVGTCILLQSQQRRVACLRHECN